MSIVQSNGDLAWYQDVNILARRPSEFFPTTTQTSEERLNAIVRLIAYGSLAAYLVGGKATYVAYGAVLIVGVSVIFRFGRPRGSATDRRNKNAGVGMMYDSDSETYTRCAYDSQATTIRRNFNKGLFRNLDDVYEVENSQRQFVTQPVTTSAPDTIAFAQFLYGSRGQTCKESTKACRPWFAVRD